MKVIQDIEKFKQRFKNPVLTIGMFDGVHLAHQRIIKNVAQTAKTIKGTSLVLTFTPHPLKVLKKCGVIPLITTLEQRIDLIRQLNVDVCLLLDFNQRFSNIPAENFVKDILVDILKINYLIVGEKFSFGREKKGGLTLLKKLSKTHGFRMRRIQSIKAGGKIVSSSRIRALIQEGRVGEANKLLGRKFSIIGKVNRGNARGRILGYPTANVISEHEVIPSRGVYAVLVKINQQILPGISNIGWRPTFHFQKGCADAIEVHIFNFNKNIYNKPIEIFFIQRIRSEKKFLSPQALLAQIKKDERKATEVVRKSKSLS